MMTRTDPLFRQIILTWDHLRQRLDAGTGSDDDELAWAFGALQLFTLLRILIGRPNSATDAVRIEVAAALAQLRGRVNGFATLVATPAEDLELGFLSAFNDDLMARHGERVRVGRDGGLSLAPLALGARLREAVRLPDDRAVA
jgi:hypothetical protein